MSRTRSFSVISLLIGVLSWLLVSTLTGKSDAWDSELYFTFVMPFTIVQAFALGYIEPRRPWRWGLFPFLGQYVTALAVQGAGAIIPAGIIVFLVLAIIPMYAGKLGALAGEFLRKRRARRTDETGS